MHVARQTGKTTLLKIISEKLVDEKKVSRGHDKRVKYLHPWEIYKNIEC